MAASGRNAADEEDRKDEPEDASETLHDQAEIEQSTANDSHPKHDIEHANDHPDSQTTAAAASVDEPLQQSASSKEPAGSTSADKLVLEKYAMYKTESVSELLGVVVSVTDLPFVS